jgi:hypothetical protein
MYLLILDKFGWSHKSFASCYTTIICYIIRLGKLKLDYARLAQLAATRGYEKLLI